MTEHERIWLEPAGAPDRCWCQDNQWGEEGVEYVLASALDGAHAEENRLRTIALDMQAGYREATSSAEASEAEVNRLRDQLDSAACLFETLSEDRPSDDVDATMMRVMAEQNRTALASTGGEHNGN